MNSTNTLEVIQTFGNKINSYIQIAAEKGNQTVEHFWPIIVRQQSIEAWTLIVGFFLIALTCTVLLIKANGNFENKNGDLTKSGIFGIIAGIVLIFDCLVMIINLGNNVNIVSKILNPEYSALQEVIRMIK